MNQAFDMMRNNRTSATYPESTVSRVLCLRTVPEESRQQSAISLQKTEQEFMYDIRPFSKGMHRLSVLVTDTAESEELVRTLAEEEKLRSPGEFAGKDACVYYKLPYVPPCDNFRELRGLILRIQEATGLRAHFQGVVALEISEWLGHTQEAYFTVMLKFLYDHRSYWKLAFVMDHAGKHQVDKVLADCSRYITPRLYDVQLFSDATALTRLVQQEFTRQGSTVSQEGAQLLADALSRPELKRSGSQTLLQRCVEEVVYTAEDENNVTLEEVEEYLRNPDGSLRMLAGKELLAERSTTNEKGSVQL